MSHNSAVDCLLEYLIAGDRKLSRQFVRTKLREYVHPTQVYYDLLWPALEKVDTLYRGDRISRAAERMATRISRCIADQAQLSLPQQPPNGKRIIITCADDEPEELGAQMCADLFESRGWQVFFLGGGIPNDEILSMVGRIRPEVLLVFGTIPTGVPSVRALIDLIRSVDANPTMNIMISGGVFNRAEGLWKEVHADLFAPTARTTIEMAESAAPRKPEIRIPGAPKKRRRRRRSPMLVAAESS